MGAPLSPFRNNGALLTTAASFTFGNTDLPGEATMMEYSGGFQAFTPVQ